MADRGRAVVPVGAVDRGVAGRGDRADVRSGGVGPGCGCWMLRPARAARPSRPPAGRSGGLRACHRHLPEHPRFAERAAARLADERCDRVMDGEALEVEAGFFDAVISRVGFIYFPDQQAAFEGMHRALSPGGGSREWCTRRRRRTGSSRSPSRSSAGARDLGRRNRVNLARLASGRPGVIEDRSREAASRRWRSGGSRRRCGWRPPPNACGSSGIRSGRCTRCCPAWTSPSGGGLGRDRARALAVRDLRQVRRALRADRRGGDAVMSVSVDARALVGPDWIAARSGDPSVRVVEVDVTPAPFDAGHIPGAVFWNAYDDLRPVEYRPLDPPGFARSPVAVGHRSGHDGCVLRLRGIPRVLADALLRP